MPANRRKTTAAVVVLSLLCFGVGTGAGVALTRGGAPSPGSLSPTQPEPTASARADAPASADTVDMTGDEMSSPAGSPEASDSEPFTTGAQTVSVSVVSVTNSTSDDTNSDFAPAQISALIAGMNQYWSAQTGGAVTIQQGDVESRSLGLSSCDANTVYNSGAQQAFGGRFAGTSWYGTESHVLILSREGCGQAGLGSVGHQGGIMFSGNGTTGTLSLPVALHEFGHNLGFGHAGSTVCKSSSDDASIAVFGTTGSQCPTQEYGDYLDIMGYSIGAAMPSVSSPQRVRAGYISDVRTVESSAGSVTLPVTPLEGGSGGLRAVKVVDPLSLDNYYVEYRTDTGYDASSSDYSAGLTCTPVGAYSDCSRGLSKGQGAVRVLREVPFADYSTYIRTTVLAVAPLDGNPMIRSTNLQAGNTFESAGGGFYLAVNSVSTSSASVTVRFTPPTMASIAVQGAGKVAYGSTRAQALRALVSAHSASVAGTVRFQIGSTMSARVPVSGSGFATLRLASPLPVGRHTVKAWFTPATGDVTSAESAVTRVTVAKAKSRLSVRAPSHVAGGSTARVAVSVTVPAVGSPTGAVIVSGAGVYQRIVLAAGGGGRAVLPLKLPADPGRLDITIRYEGSTTVASARARASIQVDSP